MKSDEEFIAGIYKKAEEKRIAEANAAGGTEHDGKPHHFHTWYGVAAAACVCLFISGAVYAGRSGRTPEGASNGTYSEQEDAETSPAAGIMLLSEDGAGASSGDDVTAFSAGAQEEMPPRGRSAAPAGDGLPETKIADAAYAGMMLATEGKYRFAAENGANAQETGGD